jgi:hypothetical protein
VLDARLPVAIRVSRLVCTLVFAENTPSLSGLLDWVWVIAVPFASEALASSAIADQDRQVSGRRVGSQAVPDGRGPMIPNASNTLDTLPSVRHCVGDAFMLLRRTLPILY